MARSLVLFLFTWLLVLETGGQSVPDSLIPMPTTTGIRDTSRVDSLAGRDSLPVLTDSARAALDSLAREKKRLDSLAWIASQPPPRKDSPERVMQGKENFFYVLLALVVILGVMRRVFGKYFADLFRIFFRRTLKQRQIYEQMIQSPLPSVLLNIYFIVTGGIYVSFLLNYFQIQKTDNFWIQSLYAIGAMGLLYLGKFTVLKFSGWLFQLSGPADDYAFIVFMINKMIGIFLLPVLILTLLPPSPVSGFVLYLSFAGLGLMYGYRIFLSYQLARNRVKVNLFHFLIYILCFEVVPLLLIYKLLLLVF